MSHLFLVGTSSLTCWSRSIIFFSSKTWDLTSWTQWKHFSRKSSESCSSPPHGVTLIIMTRKIQSSFHRKFRKSHAKISFTKEVFPGQKREETHNESISFYLVPIFPISFVYKYVNTVNHTKNSGPSGYTLVSHLKWCNDLLKRRGELIP